MKKTLLAFAAKLRDLFKSMFAYNPELPSGNTAQPFLLLFFIHLNKWLDEGMPEDEVFGKSRTTCSSLYAWLSNRVRVGSESYISTRYQYMFYLLNLYGNYTFPFNETIDELIKEIETECVWENPLRVKAAKDAIEHLSSAIATKED